MAARPVPERVRLTPRSAVWSVALLGLTLALLRLAMAAQRVLGWVLAAAALAGLLHPLVARLARRLPHGLAVAIVALGVAASVGVVAYELVGELARETARLRREAPAAADRLERSTGGLAEVARDVHLARRTSRFVDEVPERLRGGTPAEAVRAAATRGVAYLATAVLTLFFLVDGGRLAAAAAAQVHDRRRRQRLERVARAAYRRGFAYARGTAAMAGVAGLVAYALARAASVPAPAPLALWVALWDVVPVVGAVIGALPIVMLGGVGHPGRGVALAAAFVGYQLLETLVAQRRLERRTIRLGPFLTVAGGMAGLELYGVGGALLTLLVLALAVAALEELASRDGEDELAAGGA